MPFLPHPLRPRETTISPTASNVPVFIGSGHLTTEWVGLATPVLLADSSRGGSGPASRSLAAPRATLLPLRVVTNTHIGGDFRCSARSTSNQYTRTNRSRAAPAPTHRSAFGGCPNLMPSPVSDGAVDGAPNSCGDGGSGDMCSSKDPVVGQPCGPGNYCPCGYFCPSGTCQIAHFHPACDLK